MVLHRAVKISRRPARMVPRGTTVPACHFVYDMTSGAVLSGYPKSYGNGTSVWPGVPHPTMCDMVSAGLLTAPFRFGFGAMQRLLSVKSFFEAIEEEVLSSLTEDGTCAKVVRLERMTVLPRCQGKKIGSRALQQALDEADKQQLAVRLATQEERNVTFYRRLGVEIVREAPYVPAKCPNWFMVRQPQGIK